MIMNFTQKLRKNYFLFMIKLWPQKKNIVYIIVGYDGTK